MEAIRAYIEKIKDIPFDIGNGEYGEWDKAGKAPYSSLTDFVESVIEKYPWKEYENFSSFGNLSNFKFSLIWYAI